MLKVGIIGATGFAGEELIKILLRHPQVKLSYLAAKIDKPQKISEVFPAFAHLIDLVCQELDIEEAAKKSDFIFLALPHTVSMEVAPEFLKKGKRVVDLSADYRLEDISIYEKWYGAKHKNPEYVKEAVYGLPEIYRAKIKSASIIANPGCYPTGAILGIAPLLAEGLVEPDQIIIDAKSGISGAGRKASLALHFCEINENLKAYKVNIHQHMPEINQELSKLAKRAVEITFTPHIVPVNRGILSTIYLKFKKEQTTKATIEVFKRFYKGEPFVRVLDEEKYPQIKDVFGTNFCDIGLKVDEQKNEAIVITCIDNLVKGASGQAVQNMNIMQGFDERLGLGKS